VSTAGGREEASPPGPLSNCVEGGRGKSERAPRVPRCASSPPLPFFWERGQGVRASVAAAPDSAAPPHEPPPHRPAPSPRGSSPGGPTPARRSAPPPWPARPRWGRAHRRRPCLESPGGPSLLVPLQLRRGVRWRGPERRACQRAVRSESAPLLWVGRVGAHCGNIHVSDTPAWVTDNAIYSTWIAAGLRPRFAALVLGRCHEEVDDERADRLLPAHAESGEPGAAQPLPEQLFGRSRGSSKGAGLRRSSCAFCRLATVNR
jgi:hypothetical protein